MLFVAKTSLDKMKGFMGRDSIEPDEAILFRNVFGGAGFHMRTVGCTLAIASLDDDMVVLDVGLMEPEVGSYTTAQDARHALEGHPDTMAKLVIGEKVDFDALFGEVPDQEPETVKTASINSNAEMVKELVDFDDLDKGAVDFVLMVCGDDYEPDSYEDDIFRLKRKQDRRMDDDYYGKRPVIERDKRPQEMREMIEQVFGDGSVEIMGDVFSILGHRLARGFCVNSGEAFCVVNPLNGHQRLVQYGDGQADIRITPVSSQREVDFLIGS